MDGILNAEKLQLFTGVSTGGSLVGFVFSHSQFIGICLPKSHPQQNGRGGNALSSPATPAQAPSSLLLSRDLSGEPYLPTRTTPGPHSPGTPDPRPLPTLPPPRRPSPLRSVGLRRLALPRNWFSGARAAQGGSSWRNLSIRPRRLRGLPAPGNRGETRPGTPAPPLSASSATPAGGPSELSTYEQLPAQRRPRAAARDPRGRDAGLLRGRPCAAHSPAGRSPSAPPGHSPFAGHESAGFAAWAPSAAPGGVLAPRAPPPPRPALRLRRRVSRGAARAGGNVRERELAPAPRLRGGRPWGRGVA